MLTQHPHEPGLLDHYRQVQREEARLEETWEWAYIVRRFAIVALGSSGAAILLAALALLT